MCLSLWNKQRWSSPIRKLGLPVSLPNPSDKGRESLRDGRLSGVDPEVGEGQHGGGGQGSLWEVAEQRIGCGVCATNNPESWLTAWRCETTHRARPGGELLPPGNHFCKGHH